jgi:hypothetical protein
LEFRVLMYLGSSFALRRRTWVSVNAITSSSP